MNSSYEDENRSVTPQMIESHLWKMGETSLGDLGLEHPTGEPLSEQEREWLEAFFNQQAEALERENPDPEKGFLPVYLDKLGMEKALKPLQSRGKGPSLVPKTDLSQPYHFYLIGFGSTRQLTIIEVEDNQVTAHHKDSLAQTITTGPSQWENKAIPLNVEEEYQFPPQRGHKPVRITPSAIVLMGPMPCQLSRSS